MKSAINRLSICPIRSKPNDAAEMISQLLFGERVQIIERYKSNWVKVRCINDHYEGWMDPKQLSPIDTPSIGTAAVALEMAQPIFCDGLSTIITIGSELPAYDGMTATIGTDKYRYSGQALDPTAINRKAAFVERLAKRWLNVPYLWGGRSPFGVDCSGYTQIIYKCLGIPLSRDSIQQVQEGEVIDFIEMTRIGDLAFFSKGSDKITHVGMMLDANKIIHASGKVRIDSIDHYGIFNEENQEYTHKLKIVKRYAKIVDDRDE